MTINAIIFDIGNVLIEWRPERLYDVMIGPERRRAMFAALDLTGMNEQIDRGADFRTTVSDFAAAHPAWRDEIMLWHDNWLDMTGPVIAPTVKLLQALRRGPVPVYALSNFGTRTMQIAEEAYPFLTDFDRRYISGHLGVTKPDPAIYAIVERDCGHNPATLFFTDDRPENIEAAAARGWQTHLFDGAEALAARLARSGLPPRSSGR